MSATENPGISPPALPESLSIRPIGYVVSPHTEKAEAPRQPRAAEAVKGTIRLLKGNHYEDALSDIEGWERIWVLFWFDRAGSYRPKVLPPRSLKKRGVFATRAPHRPNPIGMSALRLIGREGLDLHVEGLDMLDRTPVIDIKPYHPFADSYSESKAGWVKPHALSASLHPEDPDPGYEVRYEALAREQLRFL